MRRRYRFLYNQAAAWFAALSINGCSFEIQNSQMKGFTKALQLASESNNFVAIDYLAAHEEWIETVAHWTVSEWSKYDPTLTMQRSLASIRGRLNTDRVPLTLVASRGKQPIATANLKDSVLVEGVPLGKTWLGSLYIVPEFRGQGIGTMLMRAAFSKAIELGLEELFLFASDHSVVPWYQKQNWEVIKELPFQNHTVKIMRWEAPKHS